jgi:hypothetical protein
MEMGHRCARLAASLTRVFYSGVVAASLSASPAQADDTLPPEPETGAPATAHVVRHANDPGWIAPAAVKKMADWVFDSRDNRGLPFLIVDKAEAKVFAFDKSGRILGTAWALVGLARGDDSVPGIGTMPLTQITPDMRTTPAGRFVASLGRDLGTLNVLWIDYPNAVSLHRVINTNPAERRLERIVSQVPAEHRISYGCINVPAQFFNSVVDPIFKDTHGIVYILPEVKEMRAVFPTYYDVNDPEKAQAALN